MDKHTLQILEFRKILDMAAAFAATAPGREEVLNTGMLGSAEEIGARSALISECRTFLSVGRSSGIEHFDDLSPLFQRIKPEDAVIEPFELRSFLPLLYSAINTKSFENDPECPGLAKAVSALKTHPDIKDSIEASIDNEGNVRDSASRELAAIRRGIRSSENKIKKVIDRILKQKEIIPHIQDFFVAERNNRLVIPVKIDSKGSVPGILHDISNTGETVYIEPYSIQHLGNDLESLRAEEKLEVYRILKRVSSLLRESREEILSDYKITAEIDALWSIARFSDSMDMSPPEVNTKGYMKINNGRHPLLWTTLGKEKREKDLVPLDIEIGRGHSCVVITGSNAGGKTVALKTIGIINLMALSGMHVPADSGTTVPLLENIFADIGDEQSIENNLSTFSAHIKRISEIVDQSGSGTLIIIDELGTGTDPEQGGALSCAILKKLKKERALTVVSTHLGTLKAFAHSEPGIINSSMEMKETVLKGVSSFRPTYKLIVGEPGTSHAFETAESLGLHEEIIRDARESLGGEGARVESLIRDLKEQKREIESRLDAAEKLRREAELEGRRLKKEVADLRSKKQDVMAKAFTDAEEFLRKTKSEAYELVKNLKKSKPGRSSSILKDISRKHDEMKSGVKAHTPEKIIKLKDVKAGQRVYIPMLDTHGTVSAVDKKAKRCKVDANGKEIMIPFSGLSKPLKSKSADNKNDRDKINYTVDTGHVDMEITPELNVIGKRVDPALSELERYLNDASMSGLKKVKIIHGIGTGRLAAAIREFLDEHPLVTESQKGDEEEGGNAVTIVRF